MRLDPAVSVRDALAQVRRCTATAFHVHNAPLSIDTVAEDFAARYAGIPATGLPRDEAVVLYTRIADADLPVLLGLYGDCARVRGWLPGLPRRIDSAGIADLLAGCQEPVRVSKAPCQERVETDDINLLRLPVLRATSRDAGPYLTMGLVYAEDRATGDTALSIHRMLVLDRCRTTIWMLPSRRLRAMYEQTVKRGNRLAVTVNIGAPPAAVIASALSSEFLPKGIGKLDVVGALAGQPVALVPAVTQPTAALAESEIVLEGYIDDQRADERPGGPGISLPEFLGYDGSTQRDLPVLTITAITRRHDAVYQAVIGPGREQSNILALAGALSVALGADAPAADLIRDLHFSAAGGGMLLLVVQVRKMSADADDRLTAVAHGIFVRHPFVKLIIFVDEDVNIASAEDVLWAIMTRANLSGDCISFDGFPALGMDPSQRPAWLATRGKDGSGSGRTFIDATRPYKLRATAMRSFPYMAES
jgi:UbiD family decarboxylase